ncbi:MAG: 3-methyladenine DNA glycosylase [Nocardioides sp.]|uniref:3-methyladenine DNA glycosylase n=1 Tax=Nocardioides sp. TaxID=35761 RepID=UPI0039E6F76D
MEVLSRAEWEMRSAAHRQRLRRYVEPHLARQRAGRRHPVHDFVFRYYAHRPSQLLRWHPGFGVGLAQGSTYASLTGYDAPADEAGTVSVSRAYLQTRLPLLRPLRRLLTATAARPANLGCFGLHEWAMVYRVEETGTRHPQPLRLGAAGTDAVVESHRIGCSHFDAYRFFTPAAAPRNTLRPGSGDRPAFEQPGCVHANMDLYKHAFRLGPLICSDLVADCFELAWEIRILDMRAAPYDMTGVVLDPTGAEWTPIPIETAAGKRTYAEEQDRFAVRAAPLRARLIAECERLSAHLDE